MKANDYEKLGFRSQVHGAPKLDPFAVLDRRTTRFMGKGAAWNYIAMQEAIKMAGLVGIAILGIKQPEWVVGWIVKKRKEKLDRALPDALDLMLICVESGISLEAAMRRVSDEIGEQSPELAEEMVLTTAELQQFVDAEVPQGQPKADSQWSWFGDTEPNTLLRQLLARPGSSQPCLRTRV